MPAPREEERSYLPLRYRHLTVIVNAVSEVQRVMKVKPSQMLETSRKQEMCDTTKPFAEPTTDELATYLEEARRQGLNAQREYDNHLRATETDLKLVLEEIAAQTQRLLRDSAAFRLAVDFGIVQITRAPVVFWCERYRNLEDDPRYLLEHDVL